MAAKAVLQRLCREKQWTAPREHFSRKIIRLWTNSLCRVSSPNGFGKATDGTEKGECAPSYVLQAGFSSTLYFPKEAAYPLRTPLTGTIAGFMRFFNFLRKNLDNVFSIRRPADHHSRFYKYPNYFLEQHWLFGRRNQRLVRLHGCGKYAPRVNRSLRQLRRLDD